MTTENTNPDLDTLLSEPETVELVSGTKVKVQRLKTRQLLRLLRVLTRGAGPSLSQIRFDADDQSAMSAQIMGLVLMSIPEAEDETVDFVLSMVTPHGFVEAPKTAKEREANEKLFHDLAVEMDNPEIDDLIGILEVVIKAETPHIAALGKRLATLLTVQQKSETAKKAAKKNQ